MSGIDEDVTREIEQFLYREARCSTSGRFHEWLELLTDDVHYWMGARSSRYPKTSKAIAINRPRDYTADAGTVYWNSDAARGHCSCPFVAPREEPETAEFLELAACDRSRWRLVIG